jgi:phosphoglycolate phosphatase-like HAD superfamily hydrolase
MTREEFIEKYWGHDLYDNLARMNLPTEVGFFCNRVYGDHLGSIKIFSDTKKVLEKLKDYKKSIITNTPKDFSIQNLKQFDIETYFDFVLTSDDVSTGKPNPEIVLKSCEKMGVDPVDVVLVGDTLSDVRAGRSAGSTVIGINVEADFKIKDISELLNIINI